MPLFKYKALDTNNCIVESNVQAISFNEAKQAILDRGFTPIRIEESKGINNISNIRIDLFKGIGIQDIISFCRQLSIIIRSGINIIAGLEILKKQTSKKLKDAIKYVELEVQKGRTLSQAMKELDGTFPELLTRMISAGEKSGNVDAILDSMGDYYERENYIRQKIKSAAVYPVILIIVALALVTFFANFILPSMEELLQGQKLPLITQVIISGAKIFTSSYSLVFLVLIILGVIVAYRILPKQYMKNIGDRLLLKIPIFNSVIKDMLTVRFSRTLYLLFKSGIDIVHILEIIKNVISNSVAEEVIEDALEGVKRGEKLGSMLDASNFFDPLVVQMINIGEETGEIEQILFEITEFYEKRLEVKIERLVAMIEPTFTLVIGAGIAVVIVAVALPLFSMVGNIDAGGFGVE